MNADNLMFAPRMLACWALLAIGLLLLVPDARADDAIAGRVLLSIGTPTAVGADGRERAVQRGAAVRRGDTLRTGPSDRVQIRFTDGSRLAMRPDSEISVDDYAFSETAAPTEARVSMSLNRGGFRTITGGVAERNPASYRVQTPFAVIGVRGTDWSAVIDDLGEGDNLILGVNEGGIFAENDGGSIDLGDGADFDFAVVRSFAELPEGLPSMPPVLQTMLQTPMPDGDDAAAGPDGDPEIIIGVEGDDEGDTDGAVVMLLTADSSDEDAPVFEIRQRCL
ncbi:MAG: FecR domain-containing protein [Gammaproteobacteria bacterium]|nr:FecR domain-containing protein [Gammaproteobacteria bacterium]